MFFMHAVYCQQMFNKTVDLINVGCGVHLQMQNTLHAPSLFLKLKQTTVLRPSSPKNCVLMCVKAKNA